MTNTFTLEELNTLLFITEERLPETNPLSENELMNTLVRLQEKLISQKLELK